MLKQIESQSGLRVYYEPASLDTLMVTASFSNETVKEAFDEVFKGTKFKVNYFENAVFVFYYLVIQTELPQDFLSRDVADTASTEILIDIDNFSK